MRTDDDILKDVIAEIRYEPNLRNDDIAVSVRDAVVTLAGFVDSYADKWRAETVIGRINGVKAVANDLEVKLPAGSERPDPDIARAVLDALEWNVLVPHEKIKATVEEGWVTLRGSVDWYYQKEEAERTVRNITGVKGVSNLITVAAGGAVRSLQPAGTCYMMRPVCRRARSTATLRLLPAPTSPLLPSRIPDRKAA